MNSKENLYSHLIWLSELSNRQTMYTGNYRISDSYTWLHKLWKTVIFFHYIPPNFVFCVHALMIGVHSCWQLASDTLCLHGVGVDTIANISALLLKQVFRYIGWRSIAVHKFYTSFNTLVLRSQFLKVLKF